MSRHIDADHAEFRLQCCGTYHGVIAFETVKAVLNDAPSIDIVFCEECRDCVEKGTGADCPSGYGYLYCRRKKSVVDEDDYCSWGVRR